MSIFIVLIELPPDWTPVRLLFVLAHLILCFMRFLFLWVYSGRLIRCHFCLHMCANRSTILLSRTKNNNNSSFICFMLFLCLLFALLCGLLWVSVFLLRFVHYGFLYWVTFFLWVSLVFDVSDSGYCLDQLRSKNRSQQSASLVFDVFDMCFLLCALLWVSVFLWVALLSLDFTLLCFLMVW
jgi:hypothetical protein